MTSGGLLEVFEQRIGAMHQAVVEGRPKPHKPIMLLAVLDLFETHSLAENRIPYSSELIDRFREYFGAVAREGDWCQAAPPYFHLRADGFWKHQPKAGRESAYGSLTTSGGGSKRILDNIEYAYFDENTFALMLDPQTRSSLRRFMIERFFSPEEQMRLWKVVQLGTGEGGFEYPSDSEPSPAPRTVLREVPNRDAAFARLIRHAYDYQCAVCGLRIIGADGSTPIDAAHLIPWRETHDDSPSNGIALCKLHHWALDAFLVSPNLSFEWTVSPLLDRRRNSERELTRFHKARILLPRERQHWPRPEAIAWRLNRLATARLSL